MIAFRVHGEPAPQGSKRHVGNGRLVENSAKVRPWRTAIVAAFLDSGQSGIAHGPVEVAVTFYLRRPKGHYGTGRNAEKVRDSAPTLPSSKPDLDKLLRSSLDGLTDCGAVGDDAQVAAIVANKQYADARHPVGAFITVEAA